ncbi:protein EARLY RESPONSIVE TO DEHYDRATION 15-like [Typha latifolia]|uniref:protein EARLY RESPONSIVE TO DEHYDRATION 15-like n=1 Tax=Typha latifolia TaxID=4733 RepID=UPI003C2B43A1
MIIMAVPSGAAGRSTLNPNAPLFIPAALQQVEDFSPQWWKLVETTAWFRDHWFHQHQEQETFDGNHNDEDLVDLLPDSFDLGITDELSIMEAEFDAAEYSYGIDTRQEATDDAFTKENLRPGLGSNAEAVIRSLNLKSPKNGVTRAPVESPVYREKPMQYPSPKGSVRRIIQQPR